MAELDKLACLPQRHGVQIVRVEDGMAVWQERTADTARASVVVFTSWRDERWIAWGPPPALRCRAAEIERAAEELLSYLREMPVGHAPAAWPDLLRDCTRAGRPGWRWRRLRARLGARWGGAVMGRAMVRDVHRLLDAGLRMCAESPNGRIDPEVFVNVERLALRLTQKYGQLRFLGALAAIVQAGVLEMAQTTGQSVDAIAAEFSQFCSNHALRSWMAEIVRTPPGAVWSPPPSDAPIAPAMALTCLHLATCLVLSQKPDVEGPGV